MTDRLGGIRRRLPEWARYRGKATWAVSAYVYAVLLALVAAFLASDWGTAASMLFGVAVGIFLIGDYYRKAAKKRVECAHCDKMARGLDRCPHCGQLTYEVLP